jgi:hypothetical protein
MKSVKFMVSCFVASLLGVIAGWGLIILFAVIFKW